MNGAGRVSAPELTRPFGVARIGDGASFLVEASPEECRLLAARMGLPAIASLSCRFDLRRPEADGTLAAHGSLRARVRQVCAVSLDEFDSDLEEAFAIRFVPDGRQSESPGIEDDDELPYAGGVLDLGEAASEQLALALPAFPRKPDAALLADEAGDRRSPFAGLAGRLRGG